ncbi:MAG: hypothetical protein ACRDKI_01990 [Solirubrobacterales bacterium]
MPRPHHGSIFLLAAFVVALVPATASAAAVKGTPNASVVSVAVSGKNVKFELDVTVGLPTGADSRKTCAGKVVASHKLSRKVTKSWSAKLKPNLLACIAKVKGKLPKAKYGKTLKFKYVFPGTKQLKKFAKSGSFKLRPPGPPTVPNTTIGPPVAINHVFAKGTWGSDPPTTGLDNEFGFTFGYDYSMSGFTVFGSTIK